MKKHTLIILSLSAVVLSGCATSKQVQGMIDENNLHYNAEIDRLKAEQQMTKSQLTEVRIQWADTVESIQKIKINTKALEEARQNLLHYCRQHSVVLSRFINSMEGAPIVQPQPTQAPAQPQVQPAPAATNIVTPPTNTAPVAPMTTPEPVY